MDQSNQIRRELQDMYLKFVNQRATEYILKGLTGRLVIDFHKGKIEKLYDQATIAGSTMLDFYFDKVVDI